ncbi:tryptophanyl-tRNA synthetase [Trypanosoma rangeli]|uniref:Tryptophanyl-tRNA synthetase n=1 Tax=Trypanosoma rangeli TaxID=5698 RepID=A0A422NDS0_TRYRA|nr:tryptophanyl-tRNA synthetase [Trypanosoma rangeli]RNF03621.1 tryptophanyl-tRNA synthetase [Trypanosoma rangeli]|eukprot:RNF03621.1 tryptophanyl-tRNA synthetase [Trypanosoma rangeli]
MKCPAPALKELWFKMGSSAEANGVITLHDTEPEVHRKMCRAFSGGGGTLEDMRGKGANRHADVVYQFIRVFCRATILTRRWQRSMAGVGCTAPRSRTLPWMSLYGHVLSEW